MTPDRPTFPWVGVVAPAMLGLGLWAFTGSGFAMIGAVLGPTMVIAHFGDGVRRWKRGSAARTARERMERENRAAVEWTRLARERDELNRAHPSIDDIRRSALWNPPMDGRTSIRAGSMSRAGMPGFPWLVDVSGSVAVIGDGPTPDSVWAALVVGISAAHGPPEGAQRLTWPSGIVLHRGESESAAVSIVCNRDGVDSVVQRGSMPERGDWVADNSSGWKELVERLSTRTETLPWIDRTRCASGVGLVDGLDWRLDLSSGSPHILVCGRTGAGKSEFLSALLCDWAERFSPRDLSWVGIDFKGGATLAPLAELRSCRGIVTDLDGPLVERAIRGIAADIAERERSLAKEGVQSVDKSSSLGRLAVVIDELPELFRQHPNAVELVADIARRGRSLGVHLVLSTQHLAPVNRDGILGNTPTRVCFPLAATHDVTSVLGSRPHTLPKVGAPIVVDPTGRCSAVTVRHSATPTDTREAAGERLPPVWLPPLRPPLVGREGFGRIDDTVARTQEPARWAASAGDVVVVGMRGSGRTTALRRLVGVSPVTWVTTVDELESATGVVVVDDIDRIVSNLPPQRQHDVPLLLAARRLERNAPTFLMSTVSWSPRLHGLVPNVLVLATPNRDSHLATGEPLETFDPSAEPGVGSWRGRRVIVYASTDSMVTDGIP